MDYIQTYIKEDFKFLKELTSLRNCSFYRPMINGIVTNAVSGRKIDQTEQFIIDTGASVNILGPKCKSIFDKNHQIDEINIQYGNSSVLLPVYKIDLLIKGCKFENISAALDLKLQNSLLSNEFFLKHIEIINFDFNKKFIKLINLKYKE